MNFNGKISGLTLTSSNTKPGTRFFKIELIGVMDEDQKIHIFELLRQVHIMGTEIEITYDTSGNDGWSPLKVVVKVGEGQ